jgi:hypothetical protein
MFEPLSEDVIARRAAGAKGQLNIGVWPLAGRISGFGTWGSQSFPSKWCSPANPERARLSTPVDLRNVFVCPQTFIVAR